MALLPRKQGSVVAIQLMELCDDLHQFGSFGGERIHCSRRGFVEFGFVQQTVGSEFSQAFGQDLGGDSSDGSFECSGSVRSVSSELRCGTRCPEVGHSVIATCPPATVPEAWLFPKMELCMKESVERSPQDGVMELSEHLQTSTVFGAASGIQKRFNTDRPRMLLSEAGTGGREFRR